MSPRTTAASRRRLSRTPVVPGRARRELVEAVVAVASIVVGTAIAIWAMRPGGIAGRQPTAVLLVVALVLVLAAAVRMLTGPGRRYSDRPLLGWGIGAGITAGIGIVAGLAWPGGLLRDGDPSPTRFPDPIETPVPEGEELPFDLGDPIEGDELFGDDPTDDTSGEPPGDEPPQEP